MKGLRHDKYGIRAYKKIDGVQHERRFQDRADAVAWLKDMHAKASARKRLARETHDTLRADAIRYLDFKKSELVASGYKSLRSEIRAWIAALGSTPRHRITRDDVLRVRQDWREAGKAPKTCNHRLRALRGLYHYLDGSKADTPCDDIPKLAEPAANPQFVSPAKLRKVAKALTDPKTRARFMVLAATGQRPAQLKRAVKGDVDLRRKVWFVRPAKGGNAIPVILTDDMRAAWRAFMAAEAWGYFDGSDYAKALYAAGWPKHIRPYNTKHTVGITLGESDAEWEDIKDWFGHKDIKTTRIYTGVVLKRFRRTAGRLEGRIGW
jgi:integrase